MPDSGIPNRGFICLCRKFYIKHTLQFFGGSLQIAGYFCGVIQLVTLPLKESAKPGGPLNPSHAASAFDGVPNSADLGGVPLGNGDLKVGAPGFKVRGDSGIDLPNRCGRHQLTKLSQYFGVYDRLRQALGGLLRNQRMFIQELL
jgi:hypothetical protein